MYIHIANIICSPFFLSKTHWKQQPYPSHWHQSALKKTTRKQRRFEKYLRGYLSKKHKEAKCGLKLFRLLSIVQYRINQENLRIFFRRLLMALKASSKVKKKHQIHGVSEITRQGTWVGGGTVHVLAWVQ